ncbi:unnamed protein product [Psylliodes chrysocephalus]|uniref:Uncharacterized protein n=1 Tax=Psylliodes chrysocephalus TaxID=3402493 RepID=A0A9P0GAZ0_9CUCU|nr:unnamed protein product [Psylliodes chrysocephala]
MTIFRRIHNFPDRDIMSCQYKIWYLGHMVTKSRKHKTQRFRSQKYHFDKRQNEIPGTSSARNLDNPSKTDGTSVELDGRDDMPDDDDVQKQRKANQKDWKKNIRQRLRQSGKEFKRCQGQAVRANGFRRNCVNCRCFKCLNNFSEEETAVIHNEFWTNTDDAKGHFYEKTTERYWVERQRNRNVRARTKTFS